MDTVLNERDPERVLVMQLIASSYRYAEIYTVNFST